MTGFLYTREERRTNLRRVPGSERRSDLLPGEDRTHVQPSDAEHWVRVYEELLRAADLLLTERVKGSDSTTRDWLTRRRNLLRGRLAWWRAQRKPQEGSSSRS